MPKYLTEDQIKAMEYSLRNQLEFYQKAKFFPLSNWVMLFLAPAPFLISSHFCAHGFLSSFLIVYGVFFCVITGIKIIKDWVTYDANFPNMEKLVEEFVQIKALSQEKDRQIQALVEELQEKGR